MWRDLPLEKHIGLKVMLRCFIYSRRGEREQYKSFEREQGKAISLVLHSCYAQMYGIHQIPGVETRAWWMDGRISMVFY